MKNKFFLCLGLFLLAPGAKIGFFDGLPLSSELDWIVLLLIIIGYFTITFREEKKLLGPILIILILLLIKICLSFFYTPNGLIGKYYVNTTNWEGNYEKSIEYRNINGTRIDKNIDFNNRSYSILKKHFKLSFFNDLKYNFYGAPKKEIRKNMPFAATYEGYFFIHKAMNITFDIQTDGYACLYLNGEKLVEVKDASYLKKGEPINLNKGNHRVLLKYFTTTLSKRSLKLSWFADDNYRKVIPPWHFFPSPITSFKYYLNKILSYFTLLIYLSLLILIVWVQRRCLPLFKYNLNFLFIIGSIFLIASIIYTYQRWSSPTSFVLSGGDDWLTYESFARTILIDDAIGKEVFYYAPLYQYFLAFLHLVFGEELIPIIFFQYFLTIFVVLVQYRISKNLFNNNTIANIGVFLTLLQFSISAYPRFLLSTIVATFLLIIVLYLFICEKLKTPHIVLGGFLMGLAIITRPEFSILCLPLVIFISFKEKRIVLLSIFLLATMIIPLIVCFRNYLVSYKFVLTTNMSVNLWLGNKPPQDLVIDTKYLKRYPEFIRNDNKLLEVAEYARQRPLSFIKGLIKKFVYCFGVNLINKEEREFPLEFIIFSLFSLAGIFLVLFNKNLAGNVSWNWLLLSVIFLHLVSLSIFFPWTYRRRLVAPVFPLLNIYGGMFLYCIADHIRKVYNRRP